MSCLHPMELTRVRRCERFLSKEAWETERERQSGREERERDRQKETVKDRVIDS